jgi:hypothetical protein
MEEQREFFETVSVQRYRLQCPNQQTCETRRITMIRGAHVNQRAVGSGESECVAKGERMTLTNRKKEK